MDVFPVDWQTRTVKGQFTIVLIGKTVEGKLVAAQIPFYPYFFAEPSNPAFAKRVVHRVLSEYNAAADAYCGVVERKTMWGFTNGAAKTMAHLAFSNLYQMRNAASSLRAEGMKTYESGMDPLLRFFHMRDILPAQWVTLRRCSAPKTTLTRADEEVMCDMMNVGPSTRKSRPPLVIASELEHVAEHVTEL
jgi:DNA polymerase delta subunit 1